MGRKNHSQQIPQRARNSLPADRELRMALKSNPPESFGVRRRLAYESARPLIDTFYELQESNDIPDNIIARTALHVTLLPRRKLDAQLRRGIVIGYEFGRKASALEYDLKERLPRQQEVQLGEVSFYNRRKYLGIQVESETLQQEHKAVLTRLGHLGLKGAFRDVPALHISLGDVNGNLTRFEREHTREVLQTALPLDQNVLLDPIEFYPNGYKD